MSKKTKHAPAEVLRSVILEGVEYSVPEKVALAVRAHDELVLQLTRIERWAHLHLPADAALLVDCRAALKEANRTWEELWGSS